MTADTDTLAELRFCDPAKEKAEWVAHGEVWSCYCPRCDCRKSGFTEEPNPYDEPCTDNDCLCHEGIEDV